MHPCSLLKTRPTEISRNTDTQGFSENKIAARKGGEVAGSARKDLEKKSGKKVSTSKNYLEQVKQTPGLPENDNGV